MTEDAVLTEDRCGFLADFDRAMMELVKRAGLLDVGEPRLVALHGDDKVLAFERGSFVFVLNFHPSRSYTGYGLDVPSGSYALALDSDEARFGGHARLSPSQVYPTSAPATAEGEPHRIELYLPSRTALVLERR